MAKKVIFIGLDGAIFEMYEKFLDDLPFSKKLIDQGLLMKTLPSACVDTPTNWACLGTGAWMGTHGINSFGTHIPGTPLHVKLPSFRHKQELIQAEYIWEALERQGKKSIVINFPVAWPAKVKDSIVIGGDGLRSPVWTLANEDGYFTEEAKPASGQGTCVTTSVSETPVAGASSKKQALSLTIPVKITPPTWEWGASGPVKIEREEKEEEEEVIPLYGTIVDQNGDGYDCLIVSDTPDGSNELTRLKLDEWSQWLSIDISGKKGWYRLKLVELSKDGKRFRLFRTLIGAAEGWGKPSGIEHELTKEAAPYVEGFEISWSSPRKQGWLETEHCLEPVGMAADDLTKQALYLCGKYEWDLLAVQLHAQDILDHSFLCRLSAPNTTKEELDEAMHYFKQIYILTDKMIQNLVEALGDEDTAICIVSDHGCVPAHRFVFTSGPFIREGLMVYKETDDNRYIIDYSKSKVFLPHWNYVWVNLKGRDPDGIVEPGAEYEGVRDKIIELLYSMKDPATGKNPIALAIRKEDARHLGQFGPTVGDVLYYFKPGFVDEEYGPKPAAYDFNDPKMLRKLADLMLRGEYSTSMGNAHHHMYLPNAAEGLASNNGILLLSGAGVKPSGVMNIETPIVDVAPTLCELLGVEPPMQSDGKPLYRFFS